MPFQICIFQPTHEKKLLDTMQSDALLRKEEDSAMTQPVSSFPKDEERASLSASFSGSVSVEAALVIPIFFLAVCCFCYLFEVMSVQLYVRSALHNVGKEIAKEAYVTPMVLTSKAEAKMRESIGEERLNRSIVKGGSAGFELGRTTIFPGTGIIQMHVKYKIVLPISMFGRLEMSCEDGFRIKGWTGYEGDGIFSQREDIVYITDTGVVYHKDYHCTYLELSIQMAARGSIDSIRNNYGEKYRPCVLCGALSGEKVYITGQGNRYHSALSCSGLKRSVYAVPISEVMGKGACSRCG